MSGKEQKKTWGVTHKLPNFEKIREKGFVYLDFRKKIVFFAPEGDRRIYSSLPATVDEYNAFVINFYRKGILECKFSELKKYCDFHGVRTTDRLYCILPVTSKFLYYHMLTNKEDVQAALRDAIYTAYHKEKENLEKRELNQIDLLASAIVRKFFSAVSSHVEELELGAVNEQYRRERLRELEIAKRSYEQNKRNIPPELRASENPEVDE